MEIIKTLTLCCLAAINNWMSSNFLQLNTKTEVLVIGPNHISNTVPPHLGPLPTNSKQETWALFLLIISTSVNTLTV